MMLVLVRSVDIHKPFVPVSFYRSFPTPALGCRDGCSQIALVGQFLFAWWGNGSLYFALQRSRDRCHPRFDLSHCRHSLHNCSGASPLLHFLSLFPWSWIAIIGYISSQTLAPPAYLTPALIWAVASVCWEAPSVSWACLSLSWGLLLYTEFEL